MGLSFVLVVLSVLSSANAHPTLQDNSILPYVPSAVAAVIFGTVYVIFGCTFLFHIFRTKSWWSLCLPIGAIISSAGYFLRIVVRQDQNQHSLGLFIPMHVPSATANIKETISDHPLYHSRNLSIVLSPCAFLAFNYIVYGHLIVAVDGLLAGKRGRKAKSDYSYIPPRLVKHVFVWSDVTTFLIQSFGGSMEASHTTYNLGSKIFLIGIILQFLSYLFFLSMVTLAHRKLLEKPVDATFPDGGWSHPTKRLFYTLYYSSVLICVRNAYRMVELALGWNGVLWKNEVFFLTLDAVPLILAIGIYMFVWPSILLDQTQALSRVAPRPDYPMAQSGLARTLNA
ncbi:RTA1 like protein-domain-containing protein [Cantharellus anzutake]|uniref:RTA1 like protein-domain-containing protein n=1 Tax=Cantharellus anzutake TaxID=1750568 RepID=UPI0019087DEE|nr:RTA1 like protein-domain-containing protein [Cantharellus anzutake]KAF8328858.1 RTA1 like protein-domain-containing protein [Cantharellus anzutake]